MNKPVAIIIDTNNSIYRMFHTRPAQIKNGHRVESVQAILDEANGFKQGKDGLPKPNALVSVFDHNGNNFRHDISYTYKATRKGMPKELRTQELIAIEAFRAQGIPVIAKEGYEADDSMGMLANHYVQLGYHVYMVTTDKDMHQLITDSIHILNPVSKKIFTPEETFKKFGVYPCHIADLLAIKGDKSDNIIGLEGVGDKTAAKWIMAHGGIKSIQENADSITGLGAKTLQSHKDSLTLALSLTLIRSEASLLTQSELSELVSRTTDTITLNKIKYTHGLVFEGDNPVKKQAAKKPVTKKAVTKKSAPKKEPPKPEFEQASLF